MEVLTLFEKLVQSLKAAGLDAEERQAYVGQYYDGVDHGQYFPVVRVETDYNFPSKRLEGICKRRGVVYDRRYHYGCGVMIYTIWTAADREKARTLDAVAATFQGAFWAYRHEHGPEDQAGMIAAGRRAVAMWQWLNNGRA